MVDPSILPSARLCVLINRAVCGVESPGVPGRRPLAVAALEGILWLLKYAVLAESAGLMTFLRTARISAGGEAGREEVLSFSGMAAGGLKLSYCLDHLLLAGGVGIARLEFGGLGEPEDDGVYAYASKPANESYHY